MSRCLTENVRLSNSFSRSRVSGDNQIVRIVLSRASILVAICGGRWPLMRWPAATRRNKTATIQIIRDSWNQHGGAQGIPPVQPVQPAPKFSVKVLNPFHSILQLPMRFIVLVILRHGDAAFRKFWNPVRSWVPMHRNTPFWAMIWRSSLLL